MPVLGETALMKREIKQLKALEALASGKTNREAAEIAGVHYNTIDNWLKEPEFAAELQAVLARQRDRMEAKLAGLAEKSATVIDAALDAKDPTGQPDHDTRLDAAKATLTTYTKIIQRHEKAVLPTGPLIVFPEGSHIALTVDQPAPPIDAVAVRVVPTPALTLPVEDDDASGE